MQWTAPAERPEQDWIAFYGADVTNREYGVWQYTAGQATGSFEVTAPAQEGVYEFRYLLDNGYIDVKRSNTIEVTVSAVSATLSASPARVAPAGVVSVEWTATDGRPERDWIGFFPVEASNTAYLAPFQYTQGATSGSFQTVAPSEEGEYEFRYLINGDYVDAVRSNPVTVPMAGDEYSLIASPARTINPLHVPRRGQSGTHQP